jgi:uncharacterized protein DUF2252
MKRRETIQEATARYEAWLDEQLTLLPDDLAKKHEAMQQELFSFLRATYYRWAQLWPEVAGAVAKAPEVLAVGDLHVENFGTWRDAEGRLVWGVNDFDETSRLPYTHDLARLATSAHIALAAGHLTIAAKEACAAILEGYRAALEEEGAPLVLAERWHALRRMASERLKDPEAFWKKLDGFPSLPADQLPSRVAEALADQLPGRDLPQRVVHRIAGLGSLGRERYTVIADWQGGKIAREAKALAPSAAVWAHGAEGETKVLYKALLSSAVRCPDPFVKVKRRWILRRLAPDCSRIELAELPKEHDETRLLHAMGWETANVHLGSRSAHALLLDLAARPADWLHETAKRMLEAVHADWEAWRQHTEPAKAARAPKGAGRAGKGPEAAKAAAEPPRIKIKAPKRHRRKPEHTR